MSNLILSAKGLFSGGQIAGIVIICLLFLGLAGYCVYAGLLLHKRGVHKMQTKQLQQQRDALLQKLNDMRSGNYVVGEILSDEEIEEETVSSSSEAAVNNDEVVSEPSETALNAETEVENVTAETQSKVESEVTLDNANTEAESKKVAEVAEEDAVEIDEQGNAVRYNRSFLARIIQADDSSKQYYSSIKNYLLSFNGVRVRKSWNRELFLLGKYSVASFVMRGKTLCLCLATDPKLFDGTKFTVEDISSKGKSSNPLNTLYRLKSDRKAAYAKELIDIVLAGFNAKKNAEYQEVDYVPAYQTTEALMKKHLVKIVGSHIFTDEKEEAIASLKGETYNRSFRAKLIQSEDHVKTFYSRVKNLLLGYENVQPADEWDQENFRIGGINVAVLTMRDRKLCLLLSCAPEKFSGEIAVKDSGDSLLPLLFEVNSDGDVASAATLIEEAFASLNVNRIQHTNQNFVPPYISTEILVERGYIKVEGISNK